MTLNEFKDIETSRDDTRAAIRERQERPKFFKRHMERLEWAIEEIDKLDPATNCSEERQLIQTRYSYVKHLQRMKQVQQ